ncbi:MAG: metallophosphatase family protein [Firmicutes bacterium]|nr:metallophosphatase family protein [Bacillota bacterium]
MLVGLIADIHSNAEALTSVLDRLSNVGELWCLGDIVGYGSDPGICVDLMKSLKNNSVIGNHDLCVLQDIDISAFSAEAAEACKWNRNHLNKDQLAFLQSLPISIEPIPGVILVHGSPGKDIWEYILSSWQADEVFSEVQASIVFVGHSHIPLMFMKAGSAPVEYIHLSNGQVFELDRQGVKYLINPGSVGQPRDGDPRASYMVFDTDNYRIEFHRIEYPVEVTQQKMLLAGLPSSLSDRLAIGI